MSRQPIDGARRRFLRGASALVGTAAVASAASGARAAGEAVAAASTAAPAALTAVDAIAAMRSGELRAEAYADALLDRAERLAGEISEEDKARIFHSNAERVFHIAPA